MGGDKKKSETDGFKNSASKLLAVTKQTAKKAARKIGQFFRNAKDIALTMKDSMKSPSQDGIPAKRVINAIKRKLRWALEKSDDDYSGDFSDTAVIKYDSGYERGMRRAEKKARVLSSQTDAPDTLSATSALTQTNLSRTANVLTKTHVAARTFSETNIACAPNADNANSSTAKPKKERRRRKPLSNNKTENEQQPFIREFFGEKEETETNKSAENALNKSNEPHAREKKPRKKIDKAAVKTFFKTRKRLISCVGALTAAIILLTVFLTVVFAIDRDRSVPLKFTDIYYDLSLEFNENATAFTLGEEIMLTNNSGCDWERAVFHLFPNAFDDKGGRIDILSVQTDRQNTYYEISGVSKTILSVFSQINAGETVFIKINAEVSLPTQDDRLGICSDGSLNLSCFYPSLSVYENGGWRTDEYCDIGDPFYSRTANFYVTVSMPESYKIASSGFIEESATEGGFTKTEITAENIRDFGMAASKNFKVLTSAAQLKSKVVTVSYFYCDSSSDATAASAPYIQVCPPFSSDALYPRLTKNFSPALISETEYNLTVHKNVIDVLLGDTSGLSSYSTEYFARAALDEAVKAVKAFSDAFGEYPYSHFTIAQTPIRSGGMEYGAFIAVAPSDSLSVLKETVIHETAHQWWYNAIGSDQINSAWLDEGLTQFSTGYYFALNGNDSAYDAYFSVIEHNFAHYAALPNNPKNYTLERSLFDFSNETEYVAISYLRGATVFDTLLKLCGQKKFGAALKIYFEDNKFSIADKADLICAFEKAGVKAGGIINAWANGNIK